MAGMLHPGTMVINVQERPDSFPRGVTTPSSRARRVRRRRARLTRLASERRWCAENECSSRTSTHRLSRWLRALSGCCPGAATTVCVCMADSGHAERSSRRPQMGRDQRRSVELPQARRCTADFFELLRLGRPRHRRVASPTTRESSSALGLRGP